MVTRLNWNCFSVYKYQVVVHLKLVCQLYLNFKKMMYLCGEKRNLIKFYSMRLELIENEFYEELI